MSKKLLVLLLVAAVGFTFFGCAKVAETTQSGGGGGGTNVTNVTGTPPVGTTQVRLSAGNVAANGNNLAFTMSALNQNGTALTGMGGGNFTGAVYGANPSISSVTSTTTLTAVSSLTVTVVNFGGTAVSAAMVMDKSGSMFGDKLVSAEIAGKLFVDQMATDPNNKTAVVCFDDHVAVEAAMMNAAANKQTLYNAVTKEAGYGGSTALYYGIANGIWEASKEAASASRVRAVVAMTDGGENASPAPYNGTDTGTVEVVNQAIKASIPVYTIGLFLDSGEASSYAPYLRSIAKETTGSADNYFEVVIGVTGLSVSAQRIKALGVLSDLYTKLAGAFSQSYTFTCTTSSTLPPGTYWLMLTLQNYGSFSGQTVVVQFVIS